MRALNGRKGKTGFLAVLLTAAGVLLYIPLQAEELTLIPKIQYELFKKVMGYERQWKKRVGDELAIGLVYEDSYRLSVWTMEDFTKAVNEDPEPGVEGVPVRLVPVNLDEVRDLGGFIGKEKIDFLYFVPLKPSTENSRLRNILEFCWQARVPTFTGVVAYVDRGVAVGFGVMQEKRQISVNLSAARAQGLDFSAQFLRLARIR